MHMKSHMGATHVMAPMAGHVPHAHHAALTTHPLLRWALHATGVVYVALRAAAGRHLKGQKSPAFRPG
jgi:hypothetical protein